MNRTDNISGCIYKSISKNTTRMCRARKPMLSIVPTSRVRSLSDFVIVFNTERVEIENDRQDGLRAKADILRETVRANNLPRSNTTDRVGLVADELGRLADRDLPVIEPSLSDARQLGSQPPRPGQEKVVPDLLKKSGRHQKAVEDGADGGATRGR